MSTDAKKETKKRTQAKKDLDEIILKIRHGESLTANLKKIKDAIDTLKRFRLKEEGTTELTIKDKKFHGAKFEFTTSKSSN